MSYRELKEKLHNTVNGHIETIKMDVAFQISNLMELNSISVEDLSLLLNMAPHKITRLLQGEYDLEISEICTIVMLLGGKVKISISSEEQ